MGFVNEAQCNGKSAKKLLLKDEATNCIGSDSSCTANRK